MATTAAPFGVKSLRPSFRSSARCPPGQPLYVLVCIEWLLRGERDKTIHGQHIKKKTTTTTFPLKLKGTRLHNLQNIRIEPTTRLTRRPGRVRYMQQQRIVNIIPARSPCMDSDLPQRSPQIQCFPAVIVNKWARCCFISSLASFLSSHLTSNS